MFYLPSRSHDASPCTVRLGAVAKIKDKMLCTHIFEHYGKILEIENMSLAINKPQESILFLFTFQQSIISPTYIALKVP